MPLPTKLSHLGHYETIHTLGTCIGNVHWERSSFEFLHALIIMCGGIGMLELYFKNPQRVFSHTNLPSLHSHHFPYIELSGPIGSFSLIKPFIVA